jgi:hypothetical protein
MSFAPDEGNDALFAAHAGGHVEMSEYHHSAAAAAAADSDGTRYDPVLYPVWVSPL